MDKKDLGIAVKILRTISGLSQSELAKRTGLDRSYIAHLEQGGSNVTLGTLTKIADGLNVKTSRIITEAERIGEMRQDDAQ